jgi:hypothetical protein
LLQHGDEHQSHGHGNLLKVFRRDVLQRIKIEENRFGFEPEITAKVARLDVAIYEVGISYYGRTYAEGKKIGWRDGSAPSGPISSTTSCADARSRRTVHMSAVPKSRSSSRSSTRRKSYPSCCADSRRFSPVTPRWRGGRYWSTMAAVTARLR